MKDLKLQLTQEVLEKILSKHGVKITELMNALLFGNPRFFKIRNDLYLAIMHDSRYITIIFRYVKPDIAHVITAYPSSQSHIRRYKKK